MGSYPRYCFHIILIGFLLSVFLTPQASFAAGLQLTGVTEGQELSGVVAIQALPTGLSDVARVTFTLNGVVNLPRYIERHSPYFYKGDVNSVPRGWNTALLPDGAYTLAVQAFDASNTLLDSVSVSFMLANHSRHAGRRVDFRGIHAGKPLVGRAVIWAVPVGIRAWRIDHVTFSLAGPSSEPDFTDRFRPYAYNGGFFGASRGWDTTQVLDGDYTLTATFFLVNGASFSGSVTFQIKNGGSPALSPTQAIEKTPTQRPASATATPTEELFPTDSPTEEPLPSEPPVDLSTETSTAVPATPSITPSVRATTEDPTTAPATASVTPIASSTEEPSTAIPSDTPTEEVPTVVVTDTPTEDVPTEDVPTDVPTQELPTSTHTTIPIQSSATPSDTPTQIVPTEQPTERPTASPVLSVESVYYVALDGNDTNDGSEARPFRSLKRGARALSPGATLLVKPGTYQENLEDAIPSGTDWSKPVTIKAYDPSNRPLFLPAQGAGWVLHFQSYEGQTQHHIIVDGFVLDASNVTYDTVKITEGAHHIRLMNSEVRNSSNQGILTSSVGTEHNEFIGLDIHDNGDDTQFDHGMYISTAWNLIDHCRIHHNAGYALHFYSEHPDYFPDNNIASNNIIYDGQGRHGGIIVGGKNNLVYNNVIYNTPTGIDVAYSGQTNARIVNNTIYGLTGGTAGGWNGIGINLFSSANSNTISNNIISNNSGAGISYSGSGNTIIEDNLLFQNSQDVDNVTGADVRENITGLDPLFVSPATGNFALRAGSPAIDNGLALNDVKTDITGTPRPQQGAYDIGAYEHRP